MTIIAIYIAKHINYDYLNLEIARHAALSDAQYLKLSLPRRAEQICSSTGHMPKYLHISLEGLRVFSHLCLHSSTSIVAVFIPDSVLLRV